MNVSGAAMHLSVTVRGWTSILCELLVLFTQPRPSERMTDFRKTCFFSLSLCTSAMTSSSLRWSALASKKVLVQNGVTNACEIIPLIRYEILRSRFFWKPKPWQSYVRKKQHHPRLELLEGHQAYWTAWWFFTARAPHESVPWIIFTNLMVIPPSPLTPTTTRVVKMIHVWAELQLQ